MAFIQSTQSDEEKDKQNQPGQLSGDSSGGVLAPPSTGSVSPTNSPSKPQSFATLQSYLKVNKPQGEALAGQVADKYGQVGTDAKTGIENAASTVSNNVKGQDVGYDPNVLKSAFDKPADFVKDQGNVDTFNKFKNASYNGPATAEGTDEFAKANADAASAEDYSKLGDTESGRKQLVSNVQQSQAPGITALNQALVSTNPNASAKLTAAKGNFAGLQDLLTNKAADVNATIAATKADADRAKAETAAAGTQAVDQYGQSIQQKVAAAKQEAIDRAAEAKQAFTPGAQQATDRALSDLGLTRDQYNKLLADNASLPSFAAADKPYEQVDLSQYLKQSDPNQFNAILDPNTVASKDDFENEKALAQLTGQDLNGVLNPAQENLAGTANLDLSSFDQAGLAEVAKRMQLYQQSTDAAAKAKIDAEAAAQAKADAAARAAGNPNAGVVRYQPVLGTPPVAVEPSLPNIPSTVAKPSTPSIGIPVAPNPAVTPPAPKPVEKGSLSAGGTPYIDPKTGKKMIAY